MDALLDYPLTFFWREIFATYPKSKIIHLVRDSKSWAASRQKNHGGTPWGMSTTAITRLADVEKEPRTWAKGVTNKDVQDLGVFAEEYERYNQEVICSVGCSQLLVMEPWELNSEEAWAQMCKFLGKEIPDEMFPGYDH